MSQLPVVKNQLPDEVDSLVIEFSDDRLLLPMSAIAEVVREVEPTVEEGMPEWMYGWLAWRNMKIPLCSFEALTERPMSALPVPAHAVVLNTLSETGELPFFALLIQNFPSPFRVAEDDQLEVLAIAEGESKKGYVMKLVVDKETAYIPDLEPIEQRIMASL